MITDNPEYTVRFFKGSSHSRESASSHHRRHSHIPAFERKQVFRKVDSKGRVPPVFKVFLRNKNRWRKIMKTRVTHQRSLVRCALIHFQCIRSSIESGARQRSANPDRRPESDSGFRVKSSRSSGGLRIEARVYAMTSRSRRGWGRRASSM